VSDGNGRLVEHFIGIANIESTDVSEVRKGYERVIRPRRGDRRQGRDAERSADLLRRVDQTGCEPSLGGLHAGEGRDRDRHEGETDSNSGQEEARQQVAQVRASHRHLREVDETCCERRHPDQQHRLHADARHELRSDRRGEDGRSSYRQVANAGLHR